MNITLFQRIITNIWKGLVLLPFAMIHPLGASTAGLLPQRVIGEAFDLGTERALYSETHCVSSDMLSREVLYRDIEQNLMAHKILDYGTGSTTPSFVQHNLLSQESIAVQLAQGKLSVKLGYEDDTKPEQVISIIPDRDMPLVIDAGFDTFVTDNWHDLLAGESLRFQFPFAAQESLVELRINTMDCTYVTETDQCFRLEMNNWILSMLVDPIELGYDTELKRLVRYRGLSNIGDGKGDGLIVDIQYQYFAGACDENDLELMRGSSNALLSTVDDGRLL